MAEGPSRPGQLRRDPEGEGFGESAPAASEELRERAKNGDEVAAARADVEQTRVEITQTADALQEKLKPENLEKQARVRATDAAQTRAQQLLEGAARNPVLVTVAGGVLALLLVRRLRKHSSSVVVFDLRKGTLRRTY